MTSRAPYHASRVVKPVFMTTISQAMSAGSNFVILWSLGRAGGELEVGKYSLAFGVYNAALGLQRATLTDPLLARRIGLTAIHRDEDNRALTASIGIALVATSVVLVVGAVSVYRQLLILALFLLGVLVQDACRFVLFRNGRHSVAACLDAAWFTVSCTSFVILRGHPGHDAALAIWGVGGACAAVAGLEILRFRPVLPRVAWSWWRHHLWPTSRWLTLEAGFFHADQQVAIFGLTAMAGAAALGTYTLAGSLVGLSVFVTTGIAVVAVARFAARSGGKLREAATVSAISFLCVALVTGVLLLVEGRVVRLLYGTEVVVPRSVILATGVIYAFVAAGGGMHALLVARRAERTLPFARLFCLCTLAPIAVVVANHHFVGALWVLALESFVYFVILAVAAVRMPIPAAVVKDALVDAVA